ncbi:MAG: UDP-3-O-(3-hydroxymyristoyl)glucosamine N-acyltransferase [Bacteroidia bacterium]
MKLQHPISLAQAADFLQCRMLGNPDLPITGLNEIHKVRTGDLTFVDFHKYYDRALKSPASVVLINAEIDFPEAKGILISDDPFRDYNRLVNRYYQTQAVMGHSTIHGTQVEIGEDSIIMHNVFLGDRVKIGKNCRIYPNVVLYSDTIIGDNVIIHANTVIGADAFYFKKRPEGYDKLFSCGRVIIANNVEIGASCTIDKGVSGDTIIGEGSKLDNQVHVGHGVEIGKNCLFAAQVGIGGKTIIDDNVTLWGQVGVQKDIHIGQGAVVLGQSGVSKSLDAGKVYFGYPADEVKQVYRQLSYVRQLPRLFQQLEGKEDV